MGESARVLLKSGAKGIIPSWLESYSGYLDDDMYAAQVSRGNVTGASPLFGYGESVAGGALTNQPLLPINIGPVVNVPSSSGVQMTVVSSSADDDKDGGTGARSVLIYYLDASLNAQVEELFLEGLTPVQTTATDIRFVQCTHINTYGSLKECAGNVSVYTAGPVVYSYINAGYKRCSSSFRRVPAGKRLMIKSIHGGCISGTSDAKGIIRIVTTKINDVDYTEQGFFIPVMSLSFQDNSVTLPLDMPVPVDAGVIVGMEYDVDKAATVTGGYSGYFEDV